MSLDQHNGFSEDPMNIEEKADPREQRQHGTDSEDERHDEVPLIQIVKPPKNPKKAVSLALKNQYSRETARPYSNSTQSDMERTPLLHPSSSLPTVVGLDDAIEDYPGPSTHTRSEVGRSELIRKRRKRRQRFHAANFLDNKPKRPILISPFMPITTQFSVDNRTPGRRPIGGPRYGSTAQLIETGSEEESGDDEASCVSSEEEMTTFKLIASLNSRDWLTIVMMCLANLCSTIAFSCIAPFFPLEAKEKGLTESQIGVVFGVFEAVMFFTAPIYGKYIMVIGSKRMFIAGMAITGVTAILFGFLNYLPSGNVFFYSTMLIRILEAFGDAAFVTSSFAISAKCFPKNIALVIGLIETFAGLGYTAGPVIGGFLYDIGGFQLPFLVLGTVLLAATCLGCYLIEGQDDEEESEEGKGMMAMLKIGRIWVLIFAVICSAITLSFLDPTLSAHLETFGLGPTVVGLMFLLCGGVYTLSAPVWGLVIDRYHCGKTLMIFGSLSTIVAMLLIGPSPLVAAYINKDLLMIGISLAILGMAAGALYLPSFQSCLDIVKEYDFDDSFHTYGCVSGIFQAAFAAGSFFGPTLGGMVVEQIGFAWTTTIIALLNVILVSVLLINDVVMACMRLCK